MRQPAKVVRISDRRSDLCALCFDAFAANLSKLSSGQLQMFFLASRKEVSASSPPFVLCQTHKALPFSLSQKAPLSCLHFLAFPSGKTANLLQAVAAPCGLRVYGISLASDTDFDAVDAVLHKTIPGPAVSYLYPITELDPNACFCFSPLSSVLKSLSSIIG